MLTLERQHSPLVGGSVLKFWKQRGDVNWIGKFDLHYDAQSRQLKLDQFHEPVRFLPDAAYAEAG